MTGPERVVFDCNVYFQALISPSGPARKLVEFAVQDRLRVFASSYVIDELRDVTSRPQIVAKFAIADTAATEFLAVIAACTTMLENVPKVFEFPRDPKDAHYVNLAVAAQAKLIVSRDKDLLSLRDPNTADGRGFKLQFPELTVLTPPELLDMLRQTPSS